MTHSAGTAKIALPMTTSRAALACRCRALRELIKIGAIRTVTERRGPGRVRLCDATVFKRAAVIAALNQAGFSLPVSGHIAFSLPFHTVLYEICDPCRILLQTQRVWMPKPDSTTG